MKKMFKRALAAMLAGLLALASLFVPVSEYASAEAGPSVAEIREQIKNADASARAKRAANFSYSKLCGAYVTDILYEVGIASQNEVNCHGKYQYPEWAKKSISNKGYYVNAYPATTQTDLKSVINTLAANGSVYNILVGFEIGPNAAGREYGHVLFIHAIIDNVIYFSESFSSGDWQFNEGDCLEYSLSLFYTRYSTSQGYTPNGVIHFTKDQEVPSEFRFVDVTYPETFRIDTVNGWYLSGGLLESDQPLTSIRTQILNPDDSVLSDSGTKTISGYSYAIRNLDTFSSSDNGVCFNYIKSPGSYKWVLTATDASDRQLQLVMPFTAVSSGSTVTATMSKTFSEEPAPPTTPPPTTPPPTTPPPTTPPPSSIQPWTGARTKTAAEIRQQITSAYTSIRAKRGSSYSGWCGAFVTDMLYELGIASKNEVNCDGLYQYPNWAKKTATNQGYKVNAYPVSSDTALINALKTLSANGQVYDLLVGFDKGYNGNTYGHVIFIHAILDGKIYFSESYGSNWGWTEGQCIECDFDRFYAIYQTSKQGYRPNGIIHFTKEQVIPSEFRFVNVTYPKTFRIDTVNGWYLTGGTLESNHLLTSIRTQILNSSGTVISESGSKSISGYQYAIRNLDTFSSNDNGVCFNYITSPGTYYWVLTATDASGRVLQLSMPFTAVSSGSTVTAAMSKTYTAATPTPAPTPTPIPTSTPRPTLSLTVSSSMIYLEDGINDTTIWCENGDLFASLTWSVDRPDILQLASTSNTRCDCYALSAGIANVTATTGDGQQKTVQITVRPALVEMMLPSAMRVIGEEAFANCAGIQKVVIPSGTTSIEAAAFKNCSDLVKVVIPSSVTSIAQTAFQNCANLHIFCQSASTAFAYAVENGIPFVFME